MTMTRTAIKTFTRTFIKNEDGATAIEYALMAALVGAAIIGSVKALGTEADLTFTDIKTEMNTARTAE
jgi:pilus assembly protein Flp/PilA